MIDTGFYQVGHVTPDPLPNGYKKGCDYYFNTCNGREQYEEFCYSDAVNES